MYTHPAVEYSLGQQLAVVQPQNFNFVKGGAFQISKPHAPITYHA